MPEEFLDNAGDRVNVDAEQATLVLTNADDHVQDVEVVVNRGDDEGPMQAIILTQAAPQRVARGRNHKPFEVWLAPWDEEELGPRQVRVTWTE